MLIYSRKNQINKQAIVRPYYTVVMKGIIMFEKIKKGDTIGVIAPSSRIDEDDLEPINNSVLLMESTGLKVKFAKNAFKNTFE